MTTDAFSLPRVVDVLDLGDLDAAIAENNGQSRAIRPLLRHPGYLIKLYVAPLAGPECRRLDKLIALPSAVGERDRRIIAEHTAWPVARVDSGRTAAVGCILPVAPAKYRAELHLPAGRVDDRYLDVDWLARPAEVLRRRGLPVPGDGERLRICRQIVAVADLLSRHNLVYSDWSYSNAFWSPVDFSAFVIDIDGCGELRVPNVFQPNWDDPLTGAAAPADNYTDRYRTALLVGRCLTGENHPVRMLHALSRHPRRALANVLLDILCCPKRRLRPPLSAVSAVLDGLPYIRMPVQRVELPPEPVAVPVIAPPPDPSDVTSHGSPITVPAVRRRSRPAAIAAWAALIALVFLICYLLTQA
jgi:hypothetical protein